MNPIDLVSAKLLSTLIIHIFFNFFVNCATLTNINILKGSMQLKFNAMVGHSKEPSLLLRLKIPKIITFVLVSKRKRKNQF